VCNKTAERGVEHIAAKRALPRIRPAVGDANETPLPTQEAVADTSKRLLTRNRRHEYGLGYDNNRVDRAVTIAAIAAAVEMVVGFGKAFRLSRGYRPR
jgi:hypothetical protein